MSKVPQFYRNHNRKRYKPTHTGIIRKVLKPNETRQIELDELSKHWVYIEGHVLYRKQYGMQRGREKTSVWQLDLTSIKPLEQSNEALPS